MGFVHGLLLPTQARLSRFAPAAGFLNMRAIPAIKLAAEGGSSEVAAWLVPLWVLCLAFCFTAAMEARSVAARYPGKRWFKVQHKLCSCHTCKENMPVVASVAMKPSGCGLVVACYS